MARAVEDLLDRRIEGGLVIVPKVISGGLKRLRMVEAGHPWPDWRGEEATREILQVAGSMGENDLLIVLVSGGCSALMVAPREGILLEQKARLSRRLMERGAAIGELNTVRKHLSQVKGGQLSRLAWPAWVDTLLLSDVLGDRLDVIGSGPTVPDPTSFSDCRIILERYRLMDDVPPSVAQLISMGEEGRVEETPKPGDPVFQRTTWKIVGDSLTAAEGAQQRAEEFGYRTLIWTTSMEGEAREVGRTLGTIARGIVNSSRPIPPPACIIASGETTVTVRGDGVGGRNQEVALGAALTMDGLEGVCLLSAGTDGVDGPTDAAGAFSDGTTVARGSEQGIDARQSLQANDSHHYFEKIGDLLLTGPTGTNVMDLMVLLVV